MAHGKKRNVVYQDRLGPIKWHPTSRHQSVVSLSLFPVSHSLPCNRRVEKERVKSCHAGQERGQVGRVWQWPAGAGCSLGPSQPPGHFAKGHCISMANFPAFNEASEAVQR